MYVDYLPTEAVIGEPIRTTKGNSSTNQFYQFVPRTYYTPYDRTQTRPSYGYINWGLAFDNLDNYHTIGALPVSDAYGEGTYSTGAVVRDSLNLLEYRYAGIDDLIIDSSNVNEYDPSRTTDGGLTRSNSDIWVNQGTSNAFKSISGSMAESSVIPYNYVGEGGYPGTTDHYPFIVFTFRSAIFSLFGLHGVDKVVIFVTNYDGSSVIETLEIDTFHKDRLFLDLSSVVGGTWTTVFLIKQAGLSLATDMREDGPSVAQIMHFRDIDFLYGETRTTSLGSSLIGHTQSRVSEFKTVISDGVEKSMVTKSYDTFNGHVLVDEADLQKVEYALSKATQGDYVFHTGTGKELYDQRVYLGKIKYSSPIEDNSGKFKINISGQSLSYGVENPLIAPDSTDGYAQ